MNAVVRRAPSRRGGQHYVIALDSRKHKIGEAGVVKKLGVSAGAVPVGGSELVVSTVTAANEPRHLT